MKVVGLTFAHPHLSTALLDDAEDARVRDRGAHGVGGVVDLLELLVVLRLVVHLDLERVDLQQLCPLLCDVLAVCTSRSLVKISQDLHTRLEHSRGVASAVHRPCSDEGILSCQARALQA